MNNETKTYNIKCIFSVSSIGNVQIIDYEKDKNFYQDDLQDFQQNCEYELLDEEMGVYLGRIELTYFPIYSDYGNDWDTCINIYPIEKIYDIERHWN